MSLLTIIQDAALELGLLSNISQVVGSSDETVRQLYAHVIEDGQSLLEEYQFPQLQKETTISLVDGQESYPLPGDFDRFVPDTEWDRTNRWMLIGSVTADTWQAYKSGITQLTPRKLYRVKGMTDNQVFIFPTPGAGDAANVLVYEYFTRNIWRPRDWSASTSFTAGSYCWNNGNVYKTTTGGTTGPTEPTHSTGSVSDGGISWTYYEHSYDKPLSDTDQVNIPERVLKLGVKWRFRKAKKFDYEDDFALYQAAAKKAAIKLRGNSSIPLNRRRIMHLLSQSNIPDTGYGS